VKLYDKILTIQELSRRWNGISSRYIGQLVLERQLSGTRGGYLEQWIFKLSDIVAFEKRRGSRPHPREEKG